MHVHHNMRRLHTSVCIAHWCTWGLGTGKCPGWHSMGGAAPWPFPTSMFFPFWGFFRPVFKGNQKAFWGFQITKKWQFWLSLKTRTDILEHGDSILLSFCPGWNWGKVFNCNYMFTPSPFQEWFQACSCPVKTGTYPMKLEQIRHWQNECNLLMINAHQVFLV